MVGVLGLCGGFTWRGEKGKRLFFWEGGCRISPPRVDFLAFC